MLEKSRLTPSLVGLASAQLAEVWKRTQEIYRSAPYPKGSPELAELAMLKSRDAEITKTVPKKQRRGKLTRLTQDQLWRNATLEESGPSTLLIRRSRTGEPNKYIIGPKGPLPGPRPGQK